MEITGVIGGMWRLGFSDLLWSKLLREGYIGFRVSLRV